MDTWQGEIIGWLYNNKEYCIKCMPVRKGTPIITGDIGKWNYNPYCCICGKYLGH